MSKLDHILKLMPQSQRELARSEFKDLVLEIIDKFNTEPDPIKIIEGLEKEVGSL